MMFPPLTSKEFIRKLLPRTHRGYPILSGRLRGARIVTSWHDYPGALLGTTERLLLDWFATNVVEGDTWLDVGAHYGYTAIALSRRVGVRGRVFAFEPVLSTATCISRTRTLNGLSQLTVVPLGLGSCELSALDLPLVRGMADSTIGRAAESEKIQVGSLDRLWPALSGDDPRIDGVKIDVQGMELDVLSGMRGLLKQWAPQLVVEVHHGVNRRDLVNLLHECGYSSAAEPIGQQRASGTLLDDHSYAFFPLRAQCGS